MVGIYVCMRLLEACTHVMCVYVCVYVCVFALPADRNNLVQQLTQEHTKFQVYKACILSTLHYGSESWTLRTKQERRLHSFHMHCLTRILGISWRDKVPNNTVMERAGITSMYTILKQRRFRWLGHVSRVEDDRIAKDLLYGELATGKRPTGRPQFALQGHLRA